MKKNTETKCKLRQHQQETNMIDTVPRDQATSLKFDQIKLVPKLKNRLYLTMTSIDSQRVTKIVSTDFHQPQNSDAQISLF